jgi:hypothetical protein
MLNSDKDIESSIRTLVFWAFFLVFAIGYSHRSDGRAAAGDNNLLHNHYTAISASCTDATTIGIPDISSLQKFYVNTLNRDNLLMICRNLKISYDSSKIALAFESLETARLNISEVPLIDLLCCLRFCNSGDVPVLS